MVIIDSVPAGVVPALYFTVDGIGEQQILLQDSALVVPVDTTFVAPENGPKSLRLILNTTATGADIDTNVYNFPLAIRFSSLPVDLKELLPDGNDLVVTRMDNTPLPYEIEQWDQDCGEALVWVKIDTVYGNNRAQSICLFWGNRSVASSRRMGAVFDTAAGFSAVYHLSSSCTDATVNGYDGVREGTVADTTGILVGAKRFRGNDHITIEGLLDIPATLTLSAWALLDTSDIIGGEIISIGDAALIRMDDGYSGKGCQGSFYSSPDAPDTATHDYLASGKFLARTGWHYFTYVLDAALSRHRFYIDGAICGEKQVTGPIHYESIGADTKIGTHGNGKSLMDFIGSIDEVSVAHTARSASWIKLCFMNQRNENILIEVNKAYR
jgi:hypothetical protein